MPSNFKKKLIPHAMSIVQHDLRMAAEFGLGTEIKISTQKLHVRRYMGLKELTTMKYLINGSGADPIVEKERG